MEHRKCGRKNIYTSITEAKRVRIGVSKQRTRKLYIYQCHLCHGYHLTSEPKDKLNKIKKRP